MDDIHFDTLTELYDRLLPAFNTKKNELFADGLVVREIDIWNFLKESKWKNGKDLTIYTMVDDILKVDVDTLKDYMKGLGVKYDD